MKKLLLSIAIIIGFINIVFGQTRIQQAYSIPERISQDTIKIQTHINKADCLQYIPWHTHDSHWNSTIRVYTINDNSSVSDLKYVFEINSAFYTLSKKEKAVAFRILRQWILSEEKKLINKK